MRKDSETSQKERVEKEKLDKRLREQSLSTRLDGQMALQLKIFFVRKELHTLMEDKDFARRSTEK